MLFRSLLSLLLLLLLLLNLLHLLLLKPSLRLVLVARVLIVRPVGENLVLPILRLERSNLLHHDPLIAPANDAAQLPTLFAHNKQTHLSSANSFSIASRCSTPFSPDLSAFVSVTVLA